MRKNTCRSSRKMLYLLSFSQNWNMLTFFVKLPCMNFNENLELILVTVPFQSVT
jgi:hypothetical protein